MRSLIYAVTKKSIKPCDGTYEIMIATYSHYEADDRNIRNTLFSSFLMFFDPQHVLTANSKKICGVKNWRLNERVDCSDDPYLKSELGRGLKSKEEYSVVGNELFLTENGETTIFKRVQPWSIHE